MIILGVDPGTIIAGIGVIEVRKNKLTPRHYETIKLASKPSLPLKLEKIYAHLIEVIDRFHPDEFAIETVFYSKNVKSALMIGHARGVAILSAVHRQLPTTEYSPKEVKMAVVGRWNASKQQVNYMVKKILNLPEPIDLDASDALGVAVCHAHRIRKGRSKSTVSWKRFLEENPHLIKK